MNTSFFDPRRAVSLFQLEAGDHAADFGAGHGHFAFILARAVGPRGRVYAIDVQKAACRALTSRVLAEHFANVHPLLADLEREKSTGLADGLLDFTLIANMLFQVSWKEAALREAGRILRPGGRMALVERNERPGPFGPPPVLRLPKYMAHALALHAEFRFKKEFDAGNYHYGMIFEKK